MARDRDSDMMSARNYAAGQKKPPSGTGAAGQNPASANMPDFLTAGYEKGKDIAQDIYSGVGAGAADLASKFRGKNLPPAEEGGAEPNFEARANASFTTEWEEKDWRVKLSVPESMGDISKGLLAPLSSLGGGNMVFPYTPTIIISHSAAYNTVAPIHNNYPFFAYQNSQVDAMTIVGQFYVQDTQDARYWTACLHYLRAITKMDYGVGSTGAPPPIVKLNGYGDYVFKDVPVIIQNFTVDMPNEVDYVSAVLSPGTAPAMDSYQGQNYGWAPAESQFSITVQPIYSRDKQTRFNYRNFITGDNLGQGYV